MTNQPLDEEAIFLAALEKQSQQERNAFVEEACEGHSELLERVKELLDSHDESIGPLDAPIANINVTLDQPLTEKPGTHIGPYKLLQQLGEGGMGVVYMAEQKEPVKRRVALKIIKPGMDTRQVIARFEAERQALAMMDHPNIAKVLDAGATESGRPYFVMELVNGLPVTKYCDEQHLTPKERLELFVPICQAVQHAHQKGIIHRDLKPSNILVALYDGRPVPKVIDFGVAKATSQTLTEKTMFTQLGQVVGTLDYMSPEQAERNQLDIDTRSDIYSLGVVLYELLTGDTPFDRTRLRSAAFEEMLRIIREEEPSKPSTKVSSSQSLPSIAANRRIEPGRLGSIIRGELDWIVMKALEKDRSRRYETASRFAEDVQHYLNDEAVVACPPSALYRFRKFARRNKVAFLTSTLVACSLIAGMIATTWQAIRVTQQRDRAVAAEKRADSETAIANAVNDFLQNDLLLMADADQQFAGDLTPDPNLQLRTLVDRASTKVEGRFADQPLVEAAIHSTLGSTYRGIGEFEQAEQHQRRALALRELVLGPEHRDTLECKIALAITLGDSGREATSEVILREVLFVRQQHIGDEHPRTMNLAYLLAWAIMQQGRFPEAELLLRENLEMRRDVLGPEHPDTLDTMNAICVLMTAEKRYPEAESLLRELCALAQRVLGAEHPVILDYMHNLADAIRLRGEYSEAEKLNRTVLEIRLRNLGREHPDTLKSMNNLALCVASQQRWAESERLFRDLHELSLLVFGEGHPISLGVANNMALILENQGRDAEAEPLYREACEVARSKLGSRHPVLLKLACSLSRVLRRNGRQAFENADFENAIQLFRDAIHWRQIGAGSKEHWLWYELARCYLDTGQYELARDALDRAIALRHDNGPTLAAGPHWWYYIIALWQTGESEKAQAYFAQLTGRLAESTLSPEALELHHRGRDQAAALLNTPNEASDENP